MCPAEIQGSIPNEEGQNGYWGDSWPQRTVLSLAQGLCFLRAKAETQSEQHGFRLDLPCVTLTIKRWKSKAFPEIIGAGGGGAGLECSTAASVT